MPDIVAPTLQGRSVHAHWTHAYRQLDNQPFYDLAFDWIGQHIPKDAHVLDAGCGAGTKTAHLLARGYKVTAVDLSRDMLAEAQRTNPAAVCQQADLTALPFPDGRFPAVVCWGVLMHIPSVGKALRELCRVTAHGGVLILSENNQLALDARLIRLVRKLRGPQAGRQTKQTAAGEERWEDTPDGQMVTRFADCGWLERTAADAGLTLTARRAGELTQMYALAPPPLRKTIHRVNRAWFSRGGWPGVALGHLLVFHRHESAG
jgi:phosphatidylethanolamine/phosphatidyl-N-methylethanolamine N-methyltransferase